MSASLVVLSAILSLGVPNSQKSPANIEYFPPGIFVLNNLPTEQGLDEIFRASISNELRNMDEPSLWEMSREKGREVYRFLWTRSFDPAVAIRLTFNADGSADLVVKALRGYADNDAGHFIINEQSHSLPVEALSFTEKLLKADFWSLPARRPKDLDVRDGAGWMMEGTKNGTYHVVDRTSPPRGDRYRDACMYLALGLAGLKIPDGKIY